MLYQVPDEQNGSPTPSDCSTVVNDLKKLTKVIVSCAENETDLGENGVAEVTLQEGYHKQLLFFNRSRWTYYDYMPYDMVGKYTTI